MATTVGSGLPDLHSVKPLNYLDIVITYNHHHSHLMFLSLNRVQHKKVEHCHALRK